MLGAGGGGLDGAGGARGGDHDGVLAATSAALTAPVRGDEYRNRGRGSPGGPIAGAGAGRGGDSGLASSSPASTSVLARRLAAAAFVRAYPYAHAGWEVSPIPHVLYSTPTHSDLNPNILTLNPKP
jgi:hypothetical protein